MKAKIDQIIICGDFNFPHIDWTTGVATVGDASHNYFTKLVKDNYLWQLVNSHTRNNNTLDLLLTNIPQKICNVHGFDDTLKSDHKVISFYINLKVEKKRRIKRRVYNFIKADWQAVA